MKVTTPPLRLLVASEAAPSLNVTVPLGVPLPGAAALTVAVKVTDWPKTDGWAEDTTAVVVLSLLTTWLRAEEVLVLKLLSAPYTAVMEWVATLKAVVLKVVVPPLKVPVPNVAAPSLNVTVPLGVPAPGKTALTLAVKVTDWPDTEGLAEEATLVVVLVGLTVWVTVPEVLVLKLTSLL